MRMRVTAIVATLTLAPLAAQARQGTIAELAWLAGHWEGVEGTTHMEEVWLEPRGGVMIGMHRDVFGNGRFFHENLMIRQTEDGVVYFASPGGRTPPTPFPLTEMDGRRATFENPDHDFPRKLVYEINAAGQLHVVATGVQNGREVRSEWTWSRRLPAPR